ncbi:hypothetical protein LMG28614_01393 [Paraburkholderia ultramafica]|uniref:Uncharacterized protein n=1 Tax=Paraburkholderia ultramafica TaxID=1544867 RepID=A0A6S7B1G9_9BURK|nr:hypothetical protein LMG28614_01393 [Paraburkholderia ultramafica]
MLPCKVVRTRCDGTPTVPPRRVERRWPGYPAYSAVFGAPPRGLPSGRLLLRLPSGVRRARAASGAPVLRRTGVNFDGQNNAGNSRRCDTQLHAANIVGHFWRRYDRIGVRISLQKSNESTRCGFQQTVRHVPAIIFPISRALNGTTFLQWLPRRSLQFADGYAATDVEPRSAANVSGSGCRRNLAFT